VEAIKPLARSTARIGALPSLGGFGAVFDPRAAGFKDPLLISTTDGVGTKLKIAIESGDHTTVGIDLVAMCVNDLIVQGAEPLFFLDYFATGKLSVEDGRAIIAGIAEGCRLADCALLGGETAEMPGMYASGDYDLAGFCVGAVERENLLTNETVQAGDAVIGVASDGVHSNGFSLVRRVVDLAGVALSDPVPFSSTGAPENITLAQALLKPTRIYVSPILHALKSAPRGTIRSLAHITGGGLAENVPRALPAGMKATVDAGNWDVPPVFKWLAATGGIAPAEMSRTFNCGVGMVLIVDAKAATTIIDSLNDSGEHAALIGEIGTMGESDHDKAGSSAPSASTPSACEVLGLDAAFENGGESA